MDGSLVAGAGVADVTPVDSQFLFGYPHVKRYSTGVHDPLLSSALYLSDGRNDVLFVANDVIFVSKATAERVRKRIQAEIGVAPPSVVLTATHTHSGPITSEMISNAHDPIVPRVDQAYLARLEDGMVAAASEAFRSRRPARIGLTVADATGVGTNRHDPADAADPQVPLLLVRSVDDRTNIAAMLVHAMHPTVLHEDSTLVSGDFPGLARIHLQKTLGAACPVLHHLGAAGDQSPRHVTRGNTFAEADRLGKMLADAVLKAIEKMTFTSDCAIDVEQAFVELTPRQFPPLPQAEKDLVAAKRRLDDLRRGDAARVEVRTAECDWFGAEETVTLSRAAAEGKLAPAAASCMPAEVQLVRVGPWQFITWPGEVFVEFALQLRERFPDTYVITLANGDLQGYLVSEQAVRERWYEATNALFLSPDSPRRLVEASAKLLESRPKSSRRAAGAEAL